MILPQTQPFRTTQSAVLQKQYFIFINFGYLMHFVRIHFHCNMYGIYMMEKRKRLTKKLNR